MTVFPLIFNDVKLNTNEKEFVRTLSKLCERDFDISRQEREYDTLFKPDHIKEYEAEISKNSFKARKLDKPGFRSTPFIKNTIYGWYKRDGETLTFKYIITFNIFTCILFLGILFATAYSLYDAFAGLNSSSMNLLISAIIVSALFIFLFNIMAEDDKMFVDEIIKKCQ